MEYFSALKKDETIDSLSMVESLRYYFGQKKPETEEYIVYGSIHFKS